MYEQLNIVIKKITLDFIKLQIKVTLFMEKNRKGQNLRDYNPRGEASYFGRYDRLAQTFYTNFKECFA